MSTSLLLPYITPSINSLAGIFAYLAFLCSSSVACLSVHNPNLDPSDVEIVHTDLIFQFSISDRYRIELDRYPSLLLQYDIEKCKLVCTCIPGFLVRVFRGLLVGPRLEVSRRPRLQLIVSFLGIGLESYFPANRINDQPQATSNTHQGKVILHQKMGDRLMV